MSKFIQYVTGTRKLGIVLVSLSMLMPVVYAIACITQDKFEILGLVQITIMALGFGFGLSLIIMLKDFSLTERLLKRLKKIDLENIGDGNLLLVDSYTGWERKIEFEGTIKGKRLWIYHEFRKGWLTMVPYLCITVDPDTTYETTELKVDRHLTAETISKSVSDAHAGNTVHAP